MTARALSLKRMAAAFAAATLPALVLVGPGASPASAATCTHTWIGGDGDWSVPANWDNGPDPDTIPGGGSVACIQAPGTYTVHVTARSGMNNMNISGAAELYLGGPSGTQTLSLASTFVDGQSAGATLFVGTAGSIGTNGRLLLSGNSGTTSGIDVCAVGFSNAGVIQVDGGGGGRSLRGQITNQTGGVVNINTDTQTPGVHSCGFNSVTNDGGAINIASGATYNAEEIFAQTAGTISVAGAMTGAGRFSVTGGSFSGNKPVLSSTNPLTVSGGAGSFVLHGSNNTDSSIGADIDLTVEGTATEDAALTHAAAGDTTTNAGAIHLTSTDAAHGASVYAYDGDADSFTNTGTIETLAGAGGFRTLGLGITNGPGGTIHIAADTDGACCSGSLRLTNAGGQMTIDASRTWTLSGSPFVQTSGTTTVNGSLVKPGGQTTVSGGTFTGNPVLLNGANAFSPLAGSGSFVMHDGSFGSDVGAGFTVTVEATATADSTVGWTGAANPATNRGTIRLTSTDNAHRSSLYSPDNAVFTGLTNLGTIDVLQGAGGTRTLGQGITNAAGGTLHIGHDTDSGCCNSALKLANAGNLTIDAGDTLSLGGSPFRQTAGTTTNNGSFVGAGNTEFTVSGGTLAGNPPVLTNHRVSPSGGTGTIVLHDSSTLDSGIGPNMTLLLEGTATANSIMNQSAGALGSTHAGTIRLTSTDPGHSAQFYSYDSNPGALLNAGLIDVVQGAGGGRTVGQAITNTATGTIHIGADTTSYFTRIAQGGTLTVDAGRTFTIAEPLTQTAGTMTVDGTFVTNQAVTIQGGTLRGAGTVQASEVDNAGGTVAPGTSPGHLAITGNYTQGAGGTLATEIAGTVAGTGHDRLAVTGTATLAGALAITTPGFTLSPGQAFQVLTAATRTGTFGTVTGGARYGVLYHPTDVTLAVTDADGDGVPDANDACPTVAAATATGCPDMLTPADTTAPETTITKAPKARTLKRKAKIKFSSNEAGVTFECKLDKGGYQACTAPFKKKLDPGKHTFLVRAIDAAGNIDPTPAKVRFKIIV